jgi:hypothetical protein
MSQVKFRMEYQGKKVEVVGGYDRPLDYHHLTVFDLDPEAEDELVWSDLEHYFPHQMRTIETAKRELEKLGIEPPEGFWEQCARKLGNALITWDGESWRQVDF